MFHVYIAADALLDCSRWYVTPLHPATRQAYPRFHALPAWECTPASKKKIGGQEAESPLNKKPKKKIKN